MPKEISDSRKVIYYVGMTLIALGAILFFTSIISQFGNPPTGFDSDFFRDPEKFQQEKHSDTLRMFLFAGLIFVGVVMMGIGKAGLAGSGIILSPEGEREDLEPWNRSKGGQIQDMLEETQLDELLTSANSSKTEIKVRCPKCKFLTDEFDKYCGNCGNKMDVPV